MSARDGRSAWRFARILLSGAMMISLTLGRPVAAQEPTEKGGSHSKSCSGLHAGIRAQIIPPSTETPSVMLSFLLLNDSGVPLDVEAGSWRLVINGRELGDLDTQQIFGNGPMPKGGYRVLRPGETYDFEKELSIAKYFLPDGLYKVSWKGTAFQSPTISVKISPAPH